VANEQSQATSPIATLPHFLSIAIKYPIIEINSSFGTSLHNKALIKTYPSMPISQSSYLMCAQTQRLVDSIEHNEIIAQTMHFSEFERLHETPLVDEACLELGKYKAPFCPQEIKNRENNTIKILFISKLSFRWYLWVLRMLVHQGVNSSKYHAFGFSSSLKGALAQTYLVYRV
jgi:hypothetical protein